MTLKRPSYFLRLIILGAQGVFYNLFCELLFYFTESFALLLKVLSYLISPRICHRFVGYLEEEAVVT